jgi:hypothetical protein
LEVEGDHGLFLEIIQAYLYFPLYILARQNRFSPSGKPTQNNLKAEIRNTRDENKTATNYPEEIHKIPSHDSFFYRYILFRIITSDFIR